MPKINDIEDMSENMRNGAVTLVIANYLGNNESFSKYDVTSGVRALLAQIADFTHADIREVIGDVMLENVKQGLDYGDSIVNGPTGEYILYTPNTVAETDDTETDTDVDNFDTMWIDLINAGIVATDKVNVTKFDTNTYKLDFDNGVFVLLITDDQKEFVRATVHTFSGAETGTIDSFKELIDNINEMYDVEDDVEDDVEVDWITLITKGFTNAGLTPLEVDKLNVSHIDSECIYCILERDDDEQDKFVVSVVTDSEDAFVSGYLHQYGVSVVSALTLDDLVKDTVEYIKTFNANVVVTTPTTTKSTRVYISKMYCDNAGFKAGTKLKISIKNQRVVAITKGKDDDYNYTVNADGRVRVPQTYLDGIGIKPSDVKITAYNGMIILSSVS